MLCQHHIVDQSDLQQFPYQVLGVDVWCISVQAQPLVDDESTEEAASEASGDDENEVEGEGDDEECKGAGGDEFSDVSHGPGLDGEESEAESAHSEDKGEEAEVKGVETEVSDGETWTLGADEHLEATPTESDSEQSVAHVDLCTPEKKPDMLWREELFTTPIYGNSGPRRAEITEMCVGLLQYFCQHEPAISKLLSLCLSISFSKPTI